MGRRIDQFCDESRSIYMTIIPIVSRLLSIFLMALEHGGSTTKWMILPIRAAPAPMSQAIVILILHILI